MVVFQVFPSAERLGCCWKDKQENVDLRPLEKVFSSNLILISSLIIAVDDE